jgi:hypothetical protein
LVKTGKQESKHISHSRGRTGELYIDFWIKMHCIIGARFNKTCIWEGRSKEFLYYSHKCANITKRTVLIAFKKFYVKSHGEI